MKAIRSVIIKSERSYNNTVSYGGLEYVVNVDIDDVESINREAIVVSAPSNIDVESGDIVIVHHNIMRENIHTDGTLNKGEYYFGQDDKFRYFEVPVSEVILKKSNGSWCPLWDFIFIKPQKQEDINLGSGMIFRPESRKGMVFHEAEIAIPNKKFKEAKKGDSVYFSKNSEHEFIIEGEVFFKCEIEDILGRRC